MLFVVQLVTCRVQLFSDWEVLRKRDHKTHWSDNSLPFPLEYLKYQMQQHNLNTFTWK